MRDANRLADVIAQVRSDAHDQLAASDARGLDSRQ
jgi:hypothetical protein